MRSRYCILLLFLPPLFLIQSEILWDELSCWFIDFFPLPSAPPPLALLCDRRSETWEPRCSEKTHTLLKGLTIRQVNLHDSNTTGGKKYGVFIEFVLHINAAHGASQNKIRHRKIWQMKQAERSYEI